MKAVRVITGTGVPLKRSDVDTDQIIPAEWLKQVERTGFEKGLFSAWRDQQDFVLNDERYAGANILVAGAAFGVGSSREHAVWAMQQYGFDAVIAPSFSDIFSNNCTKNGLVPVVVPEATVQAIWAAMTTCSCPRHRHCRKPMCDDDCRAGRHQFLKRLLDHTLALCIECTGRFVE